MWRLPWSVVIADQFTLLEFTPKLNLNLEAWGTMEIHLFFLNWVFTADVLPYAFTPFDMTIRMDPVQPQRWCHGLEYYGDALLFEIDFEEAVNECHWGLFGQLFESTDHLDCQWRHYEPTKSLFDVQITEYIDFFGEYYKYRCMNWNSASWSDWPLSDEQIHDAL